MWSCESSNASQTLLVQWVERERARPSSLDMHLSEQAQLMRVIRMRIGRCRNIKTSQDTGDEPIVSFQQDQQLIGGIRSPGGRGLPCMVGKKGCS